MTPNRPNGTRIRDCAGMIQLKFDSKSSNSMRIFDHAGATQLKFDSKSSDGMGIRDCAGATQLKFDIKKFCQYADSRLSRCDAIEIRYEKVLPVCGFAIIPVQYY